MFAYLTLMELFRRGFAFDIPGLIFSRVIPVVFLCLAATAFYEQSKNGVQNCQHSYFAAGSQSDSLKAKTETFCYTPFATRIQTRNAEEEIHWHGHYSIMAPYFLVVAIIFISPDLLMAFSGIPTSVLRNAADKQSKPEAIARDLVEWLDWHFQGPDQPANGQTSGSNGQTSGTALPSSPASSSASSPPIQTGADSGGKASSQADQSASASGIASIDSMEVMKSFSEPKSLEIVPEPDQSYGAVGEAIANVDFQRMLAQQYEQLTEGSYKPPSPVSSSAATECNQCPDSSNSAIESPALADESSQPQAASAPKVPGSGSLSQLSDPSAITACASATVSGASPTASVTIPRGWAKHRWTSKQRWRLVACFAAARAGSILLCPAIIIVSDFLFFNDFVLLNARAIFNETDGICRTTILDAGDESRPIRLKAVCNLSANFTFRWLVLIEYGVLIILALGMIGASVYWIVQYRNRVEFIASAVRRHLREKRKAIDHADVRAFAEYVPADLWFCLRLLASRKLCSTKVNEIAGRLFLQNIFEEANAAPDAPLDLSPPKRSRTRQEILDA